jgi:hypothetical protein
MPPDIRQIKCLTKAMCRTDGIYQLYKGKLLTLKVWLMSVTEVKVPADERGVSAVHALGFCRRRRTGSRMTRRGSSGDILTLRWNGVDESLSPEVPEAQLIDDPDLSCCLSNGIQKRLYL